MQGTFWTWFLSLLSHAGTMLLPPNGLTSSVIGCEAAHVGDWKDLGILEHVAWLKWERSRQKLVILALWRLRQEDREVEAPGGNRENNPRREAVGCCCLYCYVQSSGSPSSELCEWNTFKSCRRDVNETLVAVFPFEGVDALIILSQTPVLNNLPRIQEPRESTVMLHLLTHLGIQEPRRHQSSGTFSPCGYLFLIYCVGGTRFPFPPHTFSPYVYVHEWKCANVRGSWRWEARDVHAERKVQVLLWDNCWAISTAFGAFFFYI